MRIDFYCSCGHSYLKHEFHTTEGYNERGQANRWTFFTRCNKCGKKWIIEQRATTLEEIEALTVADKLTEE